MKKGNEYSNPFMKSRVDEMVDALSQKTGQKPQQAGEKPKLGRWAHLEGKQFASTEQNLARQAEGKERDWDLPFSPDAQVPESVREKHIRNITPDEHHLIEGLRKRGHDNTLGASVKSSATPERKASAAHHFGVSGSLKMSDLSESDKARITNLQPIESTEPKMEVRKLTWWQAFRYWLAGGKVWDGRE